VSTAVPAVGALCIFVRAGAGAICTQSRVNPYLGIDGLTLLAAGWMASDALEAVLRRDPLREVRQLGVVDAQGRDAVYTGRNCPAWAGHRTGGGYTVQGNTLTGEGTIAAMTQAFEADPGADLPERLMRALEAGQAAGGDRRGRQSAALYVASPGGGYGGGSDVEVDLRVDDHPDPVAELHRLLDLHVLYLGKPDPASLLTLAGELAGEVRERLAALGFTGPAGEVGLDAALADWAGIENYEERLVPGRIDPLVLAKLREAKPR
jgi:uncharacterized Ntn-hydrolase superfamily protein